MSVKSTLQVITSSQNPKFQVWRSLLKSSGIKENKLFLLSGEKLIREALKLKSLKISALLKTEKTPNLNISCDTFELSSSLFDQLDIVGTHFPLLVLELPEIPNTEPQESPQGIEVVLPVGDPGNLGALIRSSVALGVNKIILTQESAHPFLPKVVKASAGSVLNANLAFGGPLQIWDSTQSFALDSSGEDIRKFKAPENFRLVIGEEGPGLGQMRNIKKLSIPIQGVESLNVTVATSIALWEINQKLSRQ